MNSHEVFIHIHQGCFAGTGAIVRLPQCQWSKPDGYGKISQWITTTKHSRAKTVCIFLGIYCTPSFIWSLQTIYYNHILCGNSLTFITPLIHCDLVMSHCVIGHYMTRPISFCYGAIINYVDATPMGILSDFRCICINARVIINIYLNISVNIIATSHVNHAVSNHSQLTGFPDVHQTKK